MVYRDTKGTRLTHNEMDGNFRELKNNPYGIIVSEDMGKGVKLNPSAPVFGWHDLIGIPQYDPTANTPEFVNCVGAIKFAQYDVGEESYICFHVPHDYAVGSDLFIHSHWMHNSSHVTGGSVTWGFEVTYAKGYNQEDFTGTLDIHANAGASTASARHMIAEVQLSSIGGAGGLIDTNRIEIDGLLFCRAYLNSNDITTDDSSVVKPFLLSVDIHYQSTNVPTIQKNGPGFYTP